MHNHGLHGHSKSLNRHSNAPSSFNPRFRSRAFGLQFLRCLATGTKTPNIARQGCEKVANMIPVESSELRRSVRNHSDVQHPSMPTHLQTRTRHAASWCADAVPGCDLRPQNEARFRYCLTNLAFFGSSLCFAAVPSHTHHTHPPHPQSDRAKSGPACLQVSDHCSICVGPVPMPDRDWLCKWCVV